MTITLTITHQLKKDGTKTVWLTEDTETKLIDEVQFNNITSEGTLKFFRGLGGSESNQKGYTCRGYRTVKLISTSPNREQRTVREFAYT